MADSPKGEKERRKQSEMNNGKHADNAVKSLPTNAKSPCHQPGLDVSDSKTPIVMMMLLMKEECLNARGMLVCATVVANKTQRYQGRDSKVELLYGCLLVRARSRVYHSGTWKGRIDEKRCGSPNQNAGF